MVILLKQNPDKLQFENLLSWLRSLGLNVHISDGVNQTVLGLVGDTSMVDISLIEQLERGETPEKFTYVDEVYFDSSNLTEDIIASRGY